MRNAPIYAVLTLLLMACVCGCGGGGDRPDMGYCSGLVTSGGKPVENITVVMKPDVGRAAMAVTNKEGRYDIEYTLGERGTKVGPTTVSFEWPLGYAAPFGIPAKYTQVNSKEKIDVKSGNNEFNFTLEPDSAAPAGAPPVIVD